MKWAKRLVIIGVILIVAAVLAVWLGGNYAAKKGVEAGGTSALGVATTVDSVGIGWLTSSVGLHGLRIANPEGYTTERLFALGRGRVSCSVPSLLTDEVQVDEIVIEEPELTVELKPGLPPRSNLGDLLSSLKSEEEKPAEEDAPGKRYRVGLIRIAKTKVRFHLLAGKTADFVLPDIEIKDLSSESNKPLLMADIFRQVLAGVGVSAFQHAKGVPAELLQGFGNTLGSATRLLGKGVLTIGGEAVKVGAVLGKGLGKAGEAAIKGVGDAAGKGVEKVGEGVGGLIKGITGGKKDEEKE